MCTNKLYSLRASLFIQVLYGGCICGFSRMRRSVVNEQRDGHSNDTTQCGNTSFFLKI